MLYIDASRYNNTENRTGVENYSYFLINELIRQHAKEICLLTPRPLNLAVEQRIIPFSRLWTHIRLSWEIFKNKKIEKLFVPSHVLPFINSKKSVITIHDVAFKFSPKSYSWKSRGYLNWAAKFAVKHAYKIIVPSQKTKADLIKFYQCKEEKIHVIPLGFTASEIKVLNSEAEDIMEKYALKKKKYFLYLGRIEWKKNSDTLIKGFKEFTEKYPDIKLVMAGFPGHGGKEIFEQIPSGLKKDIILPGYISEVEKQVLLKNTLSFIFPSREEGFGLPLLEAMNAGVPIIASNIPTSKEIAKDNALFFEVEDSQGLANAMKNIIEAKNHKDLKTDKHLSTLKKYSWSKCAKEVYNVITS